MARLGLVTLELLLADLRGPVLAGDLPVRMDLEMARYERVGDGSDYDCDSPAGAAPGRTLNRVRRLGDGRFLAQLIAVVAVPG